MQVRLIQVGDDGTETAIWVSWLWTQRPSV
jgi:hypothetical protein